MSRMVSKTLTSHEFHTIYDQNHESVQIGTANVGLEVDAPATIMRIRISVKVETGIRLKSI
jgi:hypothetical protein